MHFYELTDILFTIKSFKKHQMHTVLTIICSLLNHELSRSFNTMQAMSQDLEQC